jgi:Zn-dependent protease with chaperone function
VAVVLKGLRPQLYEHSLDKRALDALEKTPVLKPLVRKVSEWGVERILRVRLTGSNLRITPDSFPALHQMVRAACDTLDVPVRPEMYVTASGEFSALTVGIERPMMVLSSATVDSLTDDELFFVIAREIGHIKSSHILYSQIAEFFPEIGMLMDGPLVSLVAGPLQLAFQLALFGWRRTSEFTADRAGLLAVQNPDAAMNALMKQAGLPRKYYGLVNTGDFIEQARQFQALDEDKLSMVAKAVSVMDSDHPWMVMRAQELLAWMDSGAYERILANPSTLRRCENLNCPALADATAKFCNKCGHRLPPLQIFGGAK